jgi:hypothetical protein
MKKGDRVIIYKVARIRPDILEACMPHLKSFLFEISTPFSDFSEGSMVPCRVLSHKAFTIAHREVCYFRREKRLRNVILASTHYKKDELVGTMYKICKDILE